jgi:diaminohydroxyphosphoribosylaminopyrimidine deaminase/5-amino-6-(5-phosphoribosylamino)uracil reductase
VHKIQAFVAPKLIGGHDAPTPLGDLGLLEMTQALQLSDTTFELVGPDLLVSGYLPASKGLRAVAAAAAAATEAPMPPLAEEVQFYKAWDEFGALSNFSPHAIRMVQGGLAHEWPTVEVRLRCSTAHALRARLICLPHVQSYYQAQKFAGVDTPAARTVFEAIRTAQTPEAAARLGRAAQRTAPETVRADWEGVKVAVMRAALRAKFTQHAAARALLLSTRSARLVENSPHDYIWGVGRDGSGRNQLGELLGELRAELAQAARTA